MIKKIGKALPYVLAGTIALSTLTGCIEKSLTKQKKDDNNNKYESGSVIKNDPNGDQYNNAISNNGATLTEDITPTVEPTPTAELTTTPVPTETPVASEDIYTHLENVYKESNKLNPLSILDMQNATAEQQASALYVYLKASEVDLEEAKKELDNVLAAASVDLMDFTSYNSLLFKELSKTLGEDKNAWKFYYPLAEYVHLANCKEEHTYNENGYINCPVIEEKVDQLNFNEFYTGYVIADISCMSEDCEVRQAMERILKADVDVNKAFTELETMFIVCAIPTDYSLEEWNEMFGELLKTVGERENVCEVYYDLAVWYHGLNCDYEHWTNDYGRIECQQYEKYYNNYSSKKYELTK